MFSGWRFTVECFSKPKNKQKKTSWLHYLLYTVQYKDRARQLRFDRCLPNLRLRHNGTDNCEKRTRDREFIFLWIKMFYFVLNLLTCFTYLYMYYVVITSMMMIFFHDPDNSVSYTKLMGRGPALYVVMEMWKRLFTHYWQKSLKLYLKVLACQISCSLIWFLWKLGRWIGPQHHRSLNICS